MLLVASSGGHLAQLIPVAKLWDSAERLWVTFDTPDAISLLAAERVRWAHHPTTRSMVNLLRNFRMAWSLLRSERPRIVVSTGAGVAVPFFIGAWLLGIPRVFIEVYDRIDSRTLSGRLCRPLASRFCVQWPEQALLYPGAKVIGTLL
ncbi:MAG: UDP-N-acetylglucosamine--LPS N-acetylglucosamine transferase [Acidimicrobiales bacterium]